jgi:hypothetical protein
VYLAHPPVKPGADELASGLFHPAPGVLQKAANGTVTDGIQRVVGVRLEQVQRVRLPGTALPGEPAGQIGIDPAGELLDDGTPPLAQVGHACFEGGKHPGRVGPSAEAETAKQQVTALTETSRAARPAMLRKSTSVLPVVRNSSSSARSCSRPLPDNRPQSSWRLSARSSLRLGLRAGQSALAVGWPEAEGPA